jgi:ubiquinone/menaquinone biosynthesis C-methylase UbiE
VEVEMEFVNSYGDATRAASYAKLEFPGTYHLAYRDLPHVIRKHVSGRNAVDVGCGTGRSTRFLKALGFDAIGIDIADDMVREARKLDPGGEYQVVRQGVASGLECGAYDLALSVFTLDNVPTLGEMVALSGMMGRLLNVSGRIVNLTSSPELYGNDWASFTTSVFPENRSPQSGDRVRVIMRDVEDQRPVEDVFWTEQDYEDVFAKAGLQVVMRHKPVATGREPYQWINETRIPPWMIFVLKVA